MLTVKLDRGRFPWGRLIFVLHHLTFIVRDSRDIVLMVCVWGEEERMDCSARCMSTPPIEVIDKEPRKSGVSTWGSHCMQMNGAPVLCLINLTVPCTRYIMSF